MTDKPDEEVRENGEDYRKKPSRLPRPNKRKPDNRMLKPNGRSGAYETK